MPCCEQDIAKKVHPTSFELLDAVLFSDKVVYMDPENGRESIQMVHKHLLECDSCVQEVQKEIKFY